MLTITKISGPLVTSKLNLNSTRQPKILETVSVGNNNLLGEIITIDKDIVQIQVYEETGGMQVGEPVTLKNELLSVELGPGLLGNIFDGIQRPLKEIDEVSPIFIKSGIQIESLDKNKKWDFIPTVQANEEVWEGKKLGYVQETELLKHWIICPQLKQNNSKYKINFIKSGEFDLKTPIAEVKNENGEKQEITMMQKWPVKIARNYGKKLSPKKIFKTGQRVVDAVFPIMLGAKVSTPGPFGAGKTFTQQQLAKWSNAQVVVYVGCGERGNEMTEMVKLFPTLKDPRTGKPLMDRTCLIANTSNMPLAAREASIYTGITIAEYFRDMGYDVVLMADSTSRWAEALREISQRLGEMPSEEGYPAYMSSRIAAFYERAGVVKTLNGEEEGSVTVVGTVSPPGGDFSEPITQTSLKNSQVFLALDAGLAAKRHYPSINWITSYSLYEDVFNSLISEESKEGKVFVNDRQVAKSILAKETDLVELVKIVGMDGLDNSDRLVLEIGKSLREDFLQQNGFDEIDTYCPFEKTMIMLRVIIGLYESILEKLEVDQENENFVAEIFDGVTKKALSDMKYNKEISEIEKVLESLKSKVLQITE
jgi:V/A-type H+/Na+-transporting ATPase subunit A